MAIAQPILTAVRRLSLVGTVRVRLQLINWTLPGHLEVDTDPAVETVLGEMDAQILQPSLDDLCDLLPAAILVLLEGHTDLGVTSLRCKKVGDSDG